MCVHACLHITHLNGSIIGSHSHTLSNMYLYNCRLRKVYSFGVCSLAFKVLLLLNFVNSQSEMYTFAAVYPMWVEVGFNVECDGSAGETYLESSPGKVSNIEKCKDSCQSDRRCNSITFLKSRWCSHFSTSCTKSKWRGKAIALRLAREAPKTPGSFESQHFRFTH